MLFLHEEWLDGIKIFRLFIKDTGWNQMGAMLHLNIVSWLGNSPTFLHISYFTKIRLCRIYLMWLLYCKIWLFCHPASGKCITDVWQGDVCGMAPEGQLMPDSNLCISFKAANMVLSVNSSTPQILGRNPSKSKSNMLYEAYILPGSWNMHAHSVLCKLKSALSTMDALESVTNSW